MSARNPAGGEYDSYDPGDPIPIRVSFTSTSPLPNFVVFGIDSAPQTPSGPLLPDGTRVLLNGTVENFGQSVTASDGTCLPNLSSLGAVNPFYAATDAGVQLFRMAGMHFPGDQVSVFIYPPHDVAAANLSVNGMVGLGFFHPDSFLIPSDEIASSWPGGQDLSGVGPVRPHQPPNGHELVLHPVSGAGGICAGLSPDGGPIDAGTLPATDGGPLACAGACGSSAYCSPCVTACSGAVAAACSDGG